MSGKREVKKVDFGFELPTELIHKFYKCKVVRLKDLIGQGKKENHWAVLIMNEKEHILSKKKYLYFMSW